MVMAYAVVVPLAIMDRLSIADDVSISNEEKIKTLIGSIKSQREKRQSLHVKYNVIEESSSIIETRVGYLQKGDKKVVRYQRYRADKLLPDIGVKKHDLGASQFFTAYDGNRVVTYQLQTDEVTGQPIYAISNDPSKFTGPPLPDDIVGTSLLIDALQRYVDRDARYGYSIQYDDSAIDIGGKNALCVAIRNKSGFQNQFWMLKSPVQFIYKYIGSGPSGNVIVEIHSQYKEQNGVSLPFHSEVKEFDENGRLKLRQELKVVSWNVGHFIDDSEFKVDVPEKVSVYDIDSDKMVRRATIIPGDSLKDGGSR
ncbi:hypothetical protein [Planctomicrobium sp. SH527]|uniref:hypothetical protein n=1 Tax=Planctomicrobium sp. SH527 TaxID=3448123 RepID=UPI003F5C2327